MKVGTAEHDVVINGVEQAQQKIQGLSAGGGAPVGSAAPNAGTPGSVVSAGGYNFVQDAQGNWKPK